MNIEAEPYDHRAIRICGPVAEHAGEAEVVLPDLVEMRHILGSRYTGQQQIAALVGKTVAFQFHHARHRRRGLVEIIDDLIMRCKTGSKRVAQELIRRPELRMGEDNKEQE